MHAYNQHNENATKNYQPSDNQYSRQSTIRRITQGKWKHDYSFDY